MRRDRLLGCLIVMVFTLLFWGGVGYGVANATTMHFVQQGAHVGGKQLTQLRDANTAYSGLIHRYWGSSIVQFHAGQGVPIIITTERGMARYCGQGAAACHGVNNFGQPVIVVGKYDDFWTLSVSHEIAETIVDPYVNRIAGPRYVEVCDPVENTYFTYRHNPSMLSDFVTPAWFGLASGSLYDVGRQLSHPAPSVAFGGYDPLTVSHSQLLKRLAT